MNNYTIKAIEKCLDTAMPEGQSVLKLELGGVQCTTKQFNETLSSVLNRKEDEGLETLRLENFENDLYVDQSLFNELGT